MRDSLHQKLTRPVLSRPIVAARLGDSHRGFARLSFPFSQPINDWIKQFPGVRFDRNMKAWVAPIEAVPMLGLPVREIDARTVPIAPIEGARSYQQEPIASAIRERSWLFALETGLGKSACLLFAARQVSAQATVLLIVPSKTISQWEDYVAQFWPERAETIVSIRSQTDEARLMAHLASDAPSPIVIVSHGLLSANMVGLLGLRSGPGLIAIDESHAIKNPKAQVTKRALALVHTFPRSARYCLTGTPISNEPLDLWAQLEFLWPGRFGSNWQYERRYFNWAPDQYAVKRGKYAGLSERFAPELKARLQACHSMLRKDDPAVAADLPSLQITVLRQQIEHKPLAAFFDPETVRHDAQARLTADAQRASGSRVASAVAFARDDGSPLKAIVVYHRQVAEAIHRDLPDSVLLTGTQAPDKRRALAQPLLDARRGTIVATMKSIGEGIDWLKDVDTVLVAELYWNIRVLEQLIGRFQRIGGSATLLTFLVFDNTIDGAILATLREKLSRARQTIGETTGQGALAQVTDDNMTDDEWALMFASAAASMQQDEYSL